jgi:hypothetical protein
VIDCEPCSGLDEQSHRRRETAASAREFDSLLLRGRRYRVGTIASAAGVAPTRRLVRQGLRKCLQPASALMLLRMCAYVAPRPARCRKTVEQQCRAGEWSGSARRGAPARLACPGSGSELENRR